MVQVFEPDSILFMPGSDLMFTSRFGSTRYSFINAEQVVAAGEISAIVADEFAGAGGRKCGCVFKCFHATESLSLPSAARTRCGVMGRLLTRTPIALATALAMAAAVGIVAGSPMPMTPRSGMSKRMISISGTSADAGEFVGLEIRIQHHAGIAVHDAFLVERVTHAHDDAAVELALAGEAIQNQAAILHDQNLLHFDETGFGIDVDFGELHAAGVPAGQTLLPLALDRLSGVTPSFLQAAIQLSPARVGHAGLLLQRLRGPWCRCRESPAKPRATCAAAAAAGRRKTGVADAHRDLFRFQAEDFRRDQRDVGSRAGAQDPACRNEFPRCRRDGSRLPRGFRDRRRPRPNRHNRRRS